MKERNLSYQLLQVTNEICQLGVSMSQMAAQQYFYDRNYRIKCKEINKAVVAGDFNNSLHEKSKE
jgi:hypothetical protein